MTTPPEFRWDWSAPRQVCFGWGRRKELGELAQTVGRRAWLVCGSRTLKADSLWQEMLHSLESAGVPALDLATLTREPLVADVDDAVRSLTNAGLADGDFLLAIGGGSAIDLAKAVAALAPQSASTSALEYLEGVGTGRKLIEAPLPVFAVPTTSGTGAEATRNAVISSFDPTFKKSLRSPRMVPQVALLDPELTVSNSPQVTAHSGLDALTQLLESYISRRAAPLTDNLCLEGLQGIIPALKSAYRDGTTPEPRIRMAYAAHLSGLALANSGLGIAHGLAAALGVHADVPHGLACAAMLPLALRINAQVAGEKLARVAALWDAPPSLGVDSSIQFVRDRIDELLHELHIPRTWNGLVVKREQIRAIVRSSHGNSRDGNPCSITDEELTSLLEEIP
ncbi:MAG: iron-containing alcohol dehydrogenase [Planctomycetales bacterium]